MNLVGREEEISRIKKLLSNNHSDFLAIYGRRRIGKTYLIDQLCIKEIVFSLSGLHTANLQEQLQNFAQVFNRKAKQMIPVPKNWLDAFHILINHLESLSDNRKKKVIFIDELPWLSTPKSKFLSSLEHFWNSWASKRTDILLVVCGSAASWMIQNIVRNKGGLHNRITQTIRLMPFTLRESELLLNSNGVRLNQYQIAQLYMVTGGVPYYLMAVEKGQSIIQIINTLCFKRDGLLRNEFEYIFQSLFSNAHSHEAIIKALSSKNIGLTRKEILKITKLSNAGSTTRLLDELVESGFIERYIPFEKKTKESLYRIIDHYTLFYLKYIKETKATSNTYLTISKSPSWAIWQGIAFENICLGHISQIKNKLGIAGVNTIQASWIKRGGKNQTGAQIDLLIDRDDNIISVCETKFHNDIFSIDKNYARMLDSKLKIFKQSIKSRKSVFLTLISTFGITKNEYAIDLVQNEVMLSDLFF